MAQIDSFPIKAQPLIADGHLERIGPAQRDVVEVAVGILIRADGAFLLTSRPLGKVYAGHWEFPGGKLESGEDVEVALRRELHEELGVQIGTAQRWHVQRVDYPHALVNLNFCKVFDWTGELQMREGQSFSWETLPVQVSPVLAGTEPVLRWLDEERLTAAGVGVDAVQSARLLG